MQRLQKEVTERQCLVCRWCQERCSQMPEGSRGWTVECRLVVWWWWEGFLF